MSDTDTTPDTAPDSVDTDTDTAPDTSTDTDKVDRAELRKVIEQRDKIKAELREIRDKIKARTDGAPDTPDKPADQGEPAPDSDTDTLRTALRETAASAVLSGRGITDEKDQAAILSVLHLDTLPVDERGKVDTSTLADTLDTLAKVFGRTPDKRSDTSRVDSRRGSGDPGQARSRDSERYKRIITKGR